MFSDRMAAAATSSAESRTESWPKTDGILWAFLNSLPNVPLAEVQAYPNSWCSEEKTSTASTTTNKVTSRAKELCRC